jgi:hypothetical protein
MATTRRLWVFRACHYPGRDPTPVVPFSYQASSCAAKCWTALGDARGRHRRRGFHVLLKANLASVVGETGKSASKEEQNTQTRPKIRACQGLGGTGLSFVRDIETHVRFLLCLPVLPLAEVHVRRLVAPILENFVERQVVTADALPKFYAAMNSATRIHNSVVAEVALFILVFTAGAWIWRLQIVPGVATWYAYSQGGQLHLTMAGYWLAFVSVPLFQFILLRWYIR